MFPKKSRYVLFLCLLSLIVLSCQGASAIPNLFATVTPTATATSTSTPIPSPTPTVTFTSTPLLLGVNTETQPDGATFVIDYDNKFQLSMPADWIVVPLEGEDLTKILSNLSKENPDFKNMAETFQNLDPDFIRVIALHKDPKYIADGYATNLTIAVVDDKVMGTMPMDFVTGVLEESLKQGGAKVSSKESDKNANGVMVGVLNIEQTVPTATGKKADVSNCVVLFQSNEKLVMISLSTPKQFEMEILPFIAGVLDSIKPYSP